jgi:hypothetical protein
MLRRRGVPVSWFFASGESLLSETNIEMALHRDIYWVGRQWAVTGYGIQACDQKQKGQFDIEVSRIWEDGALESMRALNWFNIEDFSKALAVARARFPEQPQEVPQPKDSVLGLIEAVLKEPPPEAPSVGETGLHETTHKETSQIETSLKETSFEESPAEAPKPVAQKFAMRIEGWPAKFVPQWRVRIRR